MLSLVVKWLEKVGFLSVFLLCCYQGLASFSPCQNLFSIFVAKRVMKRVTVLQCCYGSNGQQGMMLFGTLFVTRLWELGGWL